jgi:hypothetical protein
VIREKDWSVLAPVSEEVYGFAMKVAKRGAGFDTARK